MIPRAFAALCFLALAGCLERDLEQRADMCATRCAQLGMKVSGFLSGGCICAADIPNCDAAWNRADAAADVALACNQTLAECVRRGGGR